MMIFQTKFIKNFQYRNDPKFLDSQGKQCRPITVCKNLQWLWGTDWKFHREGDCLASWSLLSDAEQLSKVTEFSIRTKQSLWILFLAYFSFDNSFTALICLIISILC